MNLTFKGFLRSYVRELTGLETDNLKKLLAAVLNDAPAAAEALMVFAAVQDKARYLAKLAKGTSVEENYESFAGATNVANEEELINYLASPHAPDRYQKVWLAYRSKKEAIQADRRVIGLMRDKTLAAMKASGTTAYGLCKTLGLNAGNVYAYLNGGDATKVSRETARLIMAAACGV